MSLDLLINGIVLGLLLLMHFFQLLILINHKGVSLKVCFLSSLGPKVLLNESLIHLLKLRLPQMLSLDDLLVQYFQYENLEVNIRVDLA